MTVDSKCVPRVPSDNIIDTKTTIGTESIETIEGTLSKRPFGCQKKKLPRDAAMYLIPRPIATIAEVMHENSGANLMREEKKIELQRERLAFERFILSSVCLLMLQQSNKTNRRPSCDDN